MNILNNSRICLVFFCIFLFSCKKDKTEPTEISKLPAATQTGANTFGCLVNGKAWVAQRNDCSIFCDASFKVYYDGANGGSLGIIAKNIDLSKNIDQSILIGFDSTNFKSQFIYNSNSSQSTSFTFYDKNNYTSSLDSLVTCTGNINLTNYNLQSGIVSGTFEFMLSKPNSPSIIITDGRFDKKL